MEKSSLLDYLPILIMFGIAAGFAGLILFLTHVVGPRRKTRVKLEAFECGIEPQGNARVPFSIKYFLVAIIFVLFDIEIIFMYPWAANFKVLGILGVIEVFTFIALLLVGFYYMLSKKALKWED
ncbi:MAG: NADH-quinone oxidoreductase subunit A [Bacteroidetes bacterium]|nr:NADH-quinone oxidoreductase subunit A [Bacteroidota bacterium]